MKLVLFLFLFVLALTQPAYAEKVEFFSRDLRFSENPSYNGKAYGWDNQVIVKAEIFLPNQTEGKARYPAVILLHGSGGIRYEREIYYAKLLARKGFIALVVETYSSRKNASVQSVSALAQVADAYAAHDYLANRSDVDVNKIFTWGFSMGGYTGYYLTDNSINRLASDGEKNFAGHISFYPGWQITFENPDPTSAPLLAVLGAADELVDIDQAIADIEHRRSKGAKIYLHVIDDAAHAWEFREPRGFSSTPVNRRKCRMTISVRGGLSWKDAGTTYASCQSNGYTVGYDKRAQRIAESIALDFLTSLTRKGID